MEKRQLTRSQSRRGFLRTSAILTGLSFVPRFLHAAPVGSTVSILHTTDLHGNVLPTSNYDGVSDLGGFARCAAQIRKWRKENPHCLTVDAGDVYQGTQVGLSTRGRIMMDGFNLLNYDAWVPGNHDFDWGIECLNEAMDRSQSSVIVVNAKIGERQISQESKGKGLDRAVTFVIKEVGGFKIALVGITTPGLPFWLHPDNLGDFNVIDPVDPVHQAMREAKAAGAEAIVFVGHMGSRQPFDDFANRVGTLAGAFPDAAVYIGGHTHRDLPSEMVKGLPYTQSAYFGINCGKVDLTFDPDTRTLLKVETGTTRMDDNIAPDPAVLSMAQKDLDAAETIQSTKVGEFTTPLTTETSPEAPSEVERLIGTAITVGLKERKIAVDGVLHGIFSEEIVPPGPVTVATAWKIIPYENYILTAELTASQLRLILEEALNSSRRSDRSLLGFRVRVKGKERERRIESMTLADGTPMDPNKRYLIAFNSFDAMSAGQRLMRLRAMLREPECKSTQHPVQTREALIAFISEKGKVGVADLMWS